jgi:LPS export ABC transporter protein LptC
LFFNESGEPESKLSAQYGNYAELKEIVHLKDSVRVINFVKEDTLFTDELMWDRRRTGREFYTDKTVKIRTPTRQLDGIGMEADQNFKSYHIIEVTGILDLPSSSLPVN